MLIFVWYFPQSFGVSIERSFFKQRSVLSAIGGVAELPSTMRYDNIPRRYSSIY